MRRKFRSLWVFHLNSGACNGCDIEILDVLTPYYDAERLGVKLVGTPRHAHALLVTGPLTRQCYHAVLKAYKAMPEKPRVVIAIGTCACSGGIFYDSYSIFRTDPEDSVPRTGGIDQAIPVDVYVPGCPPRPEEILYGIALAIGIAEKRISKEIYSEGVPSAPAQGPLPEHLRLTLRDKLRHAIGYFEGDRVLRYFIKLYERSLKSDNPERELERLVSKSLEEEKDDRIKFGLRIAYTAFKNYEKELESMSPFRRCES